MTFLGSVDDINAALDGLEFMPSTVDFVGTANVQITTTDLASSLNGGPQSTTNSVRHHSIGATDYQASAARLSTRDSSTDYDPMSTRHFRPIASIPRSISTGATRDRRPRAWRATRFTACWAGEIQAPADGTYKFRVTTGDGGHGYSASTVAQTAITAPGTEPAQDTVQLTAVNGIPSSFHYSQSGGQAQAKVEWLQPGQDRISGR